MPEIDLANSLQTVIQALPVVAVLLYVWIRAERRADTWIDRYRDLDRLYRGTLRELNSLQPELIPANGDLKAGGE